MCEYCGCQAIPAIALLTAEHDRALELVRNITTAIRARDVDAACRSAAVLADLLAPHTAVEEQALFPVLADEFPDHIRVLQTEHTAIETVLAEMSGGEAVGSGWEDRLRQAMHLLTEHIFKEQDGVFPAALTSLDPADWDRLDEVRQRVMDAAGSGDLQPSGGPDTTRAASRTGAVGG